MNLAAIIFVVLSVIVTSRFCSCAMECSSDGVEPKLRPCRCKISGSPTPALNGKWIDLAPLADALVDMVSKSGYNYTWQPCYPNAWAAGKAREKTCTVSNNPAICQYDPHSANYHCTGRQDTAAFEWDTAGDSPAWLLNFTRGEYSDEDKYKRDRTSGIRLKCDKTATTPTGTVLQDTDTIDYKFQLVSKYACPVDHPYAPPDKKGSRGGLSTGSVMVIIFFVVVTVYMVGGVVYLRGTKGAEGAEMVPNYDFWVMLPGLVKDGLLFLVSLGRGNKSTYETI